MLGSLPFRLIATLSLWLTLSAAANPISSALTEIQIVDLRVAGIGHQLLTANVARCAKTMPGTGLVLHSLRQYSKAAQIEALGLYDFPAPVSVAAVVPNSPAALAGIRPGDGLLAINGSALAVRESSMTSATAQRDEAERRIAALPPADPIKLKLVRRESQIEVTLIPKPACRSRLEAVAGYSVKARSDGETIQVGVTFAARLTDDGLAYAMAHELAHTILDHRAKLAALEAKPQTKPVKQEWTRMARQFEDDADRLSLYLMADAGWDPATAPRFLRGQGRHYDGDTRIHRSAPERARLLEQEIARMPARTLAASKQ